MEQRFAATSIWNYAQSANPVPCRLALARRFRVAYPEMRHAILSVLLLLVMGVQTWAPACSLRCSTMAMPCHGSMRGMAHCHQTPPTQRNHGVDSKALPALHGCSSPACQRDDALLQGRATCEAEPPFRLVSLGAPPLLPFEVAGAWRSGSYREKQISPHSFALTTSLRI